MLRWIVAAALALAVTLPTQWAAAVVNLNTATKDELIALPGIGPAKAQAILDYRSTNGAFKSVEELKDVKGIGARRFEKLKAELTVTAPPKAVAAAGKPESKPDAAKPAVSAAKGEIRPVADARSKK
ncbi:MAG: helix-hairpin-helix domain-containing protein [Betaproteobacteria bacterium]